MQNVRAGGDVVSTIDGYVIEATLTVHVQVEFTMTDRNTLAEVADHAKSFASSLVSRALDASVQAQDTPLVGSGVPDSGVELGKITIVR